MADKKVSALTAITDMSSDDLMLVVNDPSGTPASRKITHANFFANVHTVSDFTSNVTISSTKLTLSANTTLSGKLVNGSGTVIGKNGKIHANNAISNNTITQAMLSGAATGVSNSFLTSTYTTNADFQTNINAMEALSNGATDGLKLAANIAAMLIAFISFVAMVNYFLSFAGTSMEEIFGIIFRPLAWTMGVPWNEAQLVGMLMGKKIVLTELVAYGDLQVLIREGAISQRSAIISTYALCGFSNFASIGIQLGGIGAMAPDRKKDLAKLVTKAMFGGAIASWLTATIAGILL